MNIQPIKGTTQQHLPIADIAEDIVLLKNGGAALVLKTTALNFSLLSEKEQQAVIFAYSSLINSLSFPVQISVISHRKDISKYIAFLQEEEKKQQNQKLASLMSSYRQFVSQVVKKKNVLEKEFYIVIPFSPYELGLSALGALSTFLPKNYKKLPYPKDYVVKRAKTVLYPKRDHLIRQSGRLGVKIQQLTSTELVRLFENVYGLEQNINHKT